MEFLSVHIGQPPVGGCSFYVYNIAWIGMKFKLVMAFQFVIQRTCPEPLLSQEFRACSRGAEGNRTPVRKPIPCSSTIIVRYLTFPPPPENGHPDGFSSFILRPYAQSFAYVVSHISRCQGLKVWVP